MGAFVKEKEARLFFDNVIGMFEQTGAYNVNGYVELSPLSCKNLLRQKILKKEINKSIIVKFTTFRHHTIIYQLIKNGKDNVKVRVYLTKKDTAS